MKRIFSLIRACMTDNMSLFKVKSKSKSSKFILPIFILFCCMFSVWTYANMFMEPLVKIHAEYVLLSLFVMITFFLTLIEGIYKSSNLLFNCKDDDLLFSLPISKSTVTFIRMFKFYVFELMYNSLFLVPAIVVYIRYVKVGISFYISSLFMIILLPIIPITLSCIIGKFISRVSSKFKFKNIVQTIITSIFLLVILYFSFNLQNLLSKFGETANVINEIITKFYYPAYAYVKMITNFKITDLLLFIIINIVIFILGIFIVSRKYNFINSTVKEVKENNNKDYKVKVNKPIIALIKKEFKRFINSPVFITNAGFGLLLFIIAVGAISFKFESISTSIMMEENITMNEIKNYMPILVYGLISFTSFMTSITSSMISLEGKSFNILKSLPIKPFTIILSKVLMATIVMIPIILIGDIILFIRFGFNIWEMIMIIIASIIIPFISETIGIIINLKYPKMDAENDTEVVKQSISSMVAVFLGMGMSFISVFGLVYGLKNNISNILLLVIENTLYICLFGILLLYMKKRSIKLFNAINV